MSAYDTDPPELGSVRIRLPFSVPGGTEFQHFLGYEYTSDFLSPSDSGNFLLDTDELSTQDLDALVLGARVEVSIDDVVQSIGYIDDLRFHGSRSSGSLLEVVYRDWFARAVDNQLDPASVRFTDAQTLEYMLQTVFAPYGVKSFSPDNLANRNLIRGRLYGDKRSKKGKPLKSYQLHALKPYDNEGVFAFASRVSQRFGLWLWPSVDGETLIVGQPDYEQDPSYSLRHKLDATSQHNNVLDWDVTKSRKDQPSFILARGFGGGGASEKSTLTGLIANPLISFDPRAFKDAVKNNTLSIQVEQSYEEAYSKLPSYFTGPIIPPTITEKFVPIVATPAPNRYMPDRSWLPITDPNAGPCFLRDTESHDGDQLAAYLRRELALRMRKVLTARYTIPGHRLNQQPVALDTIVDVDDDRSGIHQPLWVIGRRFHKAAGATGTTTTIECILPGTLIF